jgi:uncharacterized protein YdhG (YjbR/CyaY superfamily)
MATKRPRVPSRPTAAQKKAAQALALPPAQQAARWTTQGGSSARLDATHARLDALVRKRFPKAEDAFEYNMRGWVIRRPVHIQEWKGTIDPNWVRIFIAERKHGITVHVWNPYDPACLAGHGLAAAGFKVMVGCIQFNRKGDVPVDALAPVLDEMRKAMRKER